MERPSNHQDSTHAPRPDEESLDWKELPDMLADEWKHVMSLRDEQSGSADSSRPPIGLALSGGGIRSATFSLGVLQALAQRKLLQRFDYLSTVSGGGYIGAWLSACIRRGADSQQGLAELENRIRPSRIRSAGEEPTELKFLRAYSNYLTPRLGAFSGDTLAALAGFLRNLGLSLVLGVMSIGVLLALVHAFVAVVHHGFRSDGGLAWAGVAAGALLFLAMSGISMMLTMQSYDLRAELEPTTKESEDATALAASLLTKAAALAKTGDNGMAALIVAQSLLNYAKTADRRRDILSILTKLQHAPSKWLGALLGGGMVLGSLWLSVNVGGLGWQDVMLGASALLLAYTLGALYALFFIEMVRSDIPLEGARSATSTLVRWLLQVLAATFRRAWGTVGEIPRYVVAFVVSAIGAWGIVYLLSNALADVMPGGRLPFESSILFVGCAPPAGIGIFWLVYLLWMAAVGNSYSEFTREWLSRIVGSLTGVGIVWFVGGMLVIHTVPAWQAVWQRSTGWMTEETLWAAGAMVVALLILSLALKRLRTRSHAQGNVAVPDDSPLVNLASLCAMLGVIAVLTMLYQHALIGFSQAQPSRIPGADSSYASLLAGHLAHLELALRIGSFDWISPTSILAAAPSLVLVVVVAAIALAAFWAVDVNTFSLQNLYRNRLVRCYLGAAHHRDRLENPYAGFDPTDDFELQKLANQRPYPLMAAAINITQGADLAWQQRKAASFLFSPLWCGFWLESTEGSSVVSRHPVRGGYVRTSRFVRETAGFRSVSSGVMIGTAIATSGAAVSSQMGFASRGPLSFLLTLLNVRLGRWLPNPARKDDPGRWGMHSPPFGAFWYLSELLGITNERSRWVYVSDGGHFENSALYELVRRRCALIVCVDAGADPHRTFGDLGNAVRKCRIDFGADIRLDPAPMRVDQADGTCAEGVAIGTIHYPIGPRDEAPFMGQLVYIKPSLPRTLNLHAATPRKEARGPRASDSISADVQAYRARHPEFPHEPTSNQWFTESQFESYRQLGFLLGMDALNKAQHIVDSVR